MSPRSVALLALALAALALPAFSGCGNSDKAGGVTAPRVLRLASADPDPFGDYFARDVRKLSNGHMRVDVTHDAAGHATADYEVRAARMLTSGRYDLATLSSDAWEELGVTSFTPFALPFLVSDQSILKAVLQSRVPAQMLTGLRARHVVGLALTPGLLRHPIGYAGPITRPLGFRGTLMHVPVSATADALASVLGATPVHLPPGQSVQRAQLLRSHRLGSDEDSVYGPPDAWFTANETLSAPVGTLVANGKSFARLSPDQRQILRTAAADVSRRALALILTDFSDAKGAVEHCDVARVLNAPPADVAAFEQTTRPLYARLERDPHLRGLIAAIQAIKARTPPDPEPKLPASCSRPVATTKGRPRSPGFLDGTYRWRVANGQVATMTLNDGKWLDRLHEYGTFKVIGDRVLFRWAPRWGGVVMAFTFRRRAGGTLDLHPLPPMSADDARVWAPAPWVRVGPPVDRLR